VLVREALAAAPLSPVDRAPHRRGVGQAQAPAEHGGDPLGLGLHHRQQPTRRVHEAGQQQPAEPGRDDAPVQRQLAATGSQQRRGQEGEVDPVPGGGDDPVDGLLGAVGEPHPAGVQPPDRGLEDDLAAPHRRQQVRGDDRDALQQAASRDRPARRRRPQLARHPAAVEQVQQRPRQALSGSTSVAS
jgi:hypothetical protein